MLVIAVDGVVKRTQHADNTISSFEECSSIDASIGDGHIFKRLETNSSGETSSARARAHLDCLEEGSHDGQSCSLDF